MSTGVDAESAYDTIIAKHLGDDGHASSREVATDVQDDVAGDVAVNESDEPESDGSELTLDPVGVAIDNWLGDFAASLRGDVGDYDDATVRAMIDRRVENHEFGNDWTLALREYRRLAEEDASVKNEAAKIAANERAEERKTYDGVIRGFMRDWKEPSE